MAAHRFFKEKEIICFPFSQYIRKVAIDFIYSKGMWGKTAEK